MGSPRFGAFGARAFFCITSQRWMTAALTSAPAASAYIRSVGPGAGSGHQ
jgi:hypothetical protein